MIKNSRHGRLTGMIWKKNKCLRFGSIGLQALQPMWITNIQLIKYKRLFSKTLKKKAKLYINIHCTSNVTKKSNHSRMGAGKGKISHTKTRIKPGLIFFELKTFFPLMAIKALKQIAYKLPIKVRII